MYAAVVTFEVHVDKIDEAVSHYQNATVPVFREHPGTVGLYLLLDRSTGRSISIGMYESEADAIALESSGTYQKLIGEFAQFFRKTPSVRSTKSLPKCRLVEQACLIPRLLAESLTQKSPVWNFADIRATPTGRNHNSQ